MKKFTIPTRAVKLMLTLLFLWNMGVQKIFTSDVFKNEQREHNYKGLELEKLQFKLNDIVAQKLQAARQKIKQGEDYTITDYFEDYTDIQLFADSTGANVPIMEGITQLQQLSELYLRKTPDRTDAITAAQEKFSDRTDPGWRERQKASQESWKQFSFWAWLGENLLLQYLRNFFIALILLLCWIYDDNKKRLQLLSPLSFIVCLLLYPITIGYVWWMKTRDFLNEVEVRSRRVKLFGLLSKEERAIVERLKGLTLREVRLELNAMGMRRKHCYVVALLAVIIIELLPNILIAAPIERDIDKREFINVVKVSVDTNAYQVPLFVEDKISNHFESDEIFWLQSWFTYLASYVLLQFNFIFYLLKGNQLPTEHIPLSVKNLEMYLSKFFTKKLKNEINKKYYSCNTVYSRVNNKSPDYISC